MKTLGGNKGLLLRFGNEEVTVWDGGVVQWGHNTVANQSDMSILLRAIFEAGRKEAQGDMRNALGLELRDFGVIGVDPT